MKKTIAELTAEKINAPDDIAPEDWKRIQEQLNEALFDAGLWRECLRTRKDLLEEYHNATGERREVLNAALFRRMNTPRTDLEAMAAARTFTEWQSVRDLIDARLQQDAERSEADRKRAKAEAAARAEAAAAAERDAIRKHYAHKRQFEDAVIQLAKQQGRPDAAGKTAKKEELPARAEVATPSDRLEAEILRILNRDMNNTREAPTAAQLYQEHIINGRTLAGLERAKGWKARTMKMRKRDMQDHLTKALKMTVDLNALRNLPRKSGRLVRLDPHILEGTQADE